METLLHKTHHNRGLHQNHAAPPASAPWRAAHVGERRVVAGVLMIREQVASERSEQAACRDYWSCCTDLAVLFCCYTLLLHYKSVMSGFLSTWVGLLSNRRPIFEWGGPIFGRVFLKICPPPFLSSHLSSSPMGVFSRTYSISAHDINIVAYYVCNVNRLTHGLPCQTGALRTGLASYPGLLKLGEYDKNDAYRWAG